MSALPPITDIIQQAGRTPVPLRGSPPAANREQVFALHVQPGRDSVMPMMGIDIPLQSLNAILPGHARKREFLDNEFFVPMHHADQEDH
jgi:hypothetical protein